MLALIMYAGRKCVQTCRPHCLSRAVQAWASGEKQMCALLQEEVDQLIHRLKHAKHVTRISCAVNVSY